MGDVVDDAPLDPVADFIEWLRSRDLAELDGYVAELEAFAGDGTRFGALASALSPVLRGARSEKAAREQLRPGWEVAFPGDPFDEIWPHTAAIIQARQELDGDTDASEIWLAALRTSRAARGVDAEISDRDVQAFAAFAALIALDDDVAPDPSRSEGR